MPSSQKIGSAVFALIFFFSQCPPGYSQQSQGNADDYRETSERIKAVGTALSPVEIASNCGKILGMLTANRDLLHGLQYSEKIFGGLSNILSAAAIGNHVLANNDAAVWQGITDKVIDDAFCATTRICPAWMIGRTIGYWINEGSRYMSADRRSFNDAITDSAYDTWESWKVDSPSDIDRALVETRARIEVRSRIAARGRVCSAEEQAGSAVDQLLRDRHQKRSSDSGRSSATLGTATLEASRAAEAGLNDVPMTPVLPTLTPPVTGNTITSVPSSLSGLSSSDGLISRSEKNRGVSG